jgi:hypothetical protein
MTIAHIGDGRYVHLEEGALTPPPPKPRGKGNTGKRVEKPSVEFIRAYKKPNKKNEFALYSEKLPGYKEYRSFYSTLRYITLGRPPGAMDGYNAQTRAIALEKAKEQVKKDMANIKKTVELSEMAEEALEGALTVLRAPASQQTKLTAAKLILEFTKSKPVAKSEVSVNKAEEWLASLSHDIEE